MPTTELPYHGSVLTLEGFAPDFASLVRNLRDFVYIVDLQGRFVFLNTKLIHAMGYDLEEARTQFLGRSFLHTLTPESQRVGRDHFVRALRGEDISPYFEVETHCKDGSTILLEVHGSHYYRDGELVGRQGVARDITELRALQRSVEEKSARLELMESRARLAGELFNKLALLTMDTGGLDIAAAVASVDRAIAHTQRERLGLDETDLAILRGLAEGQTNAELGRAVHLSRHTIKDRLERMTETAGCRRRAALVAWAVRTGLV